MAYVVLAEFCARPDRVEAFADLLDRHADDSLTREEGCLTFDICQDPEETTRFLLYEVYRHEEAYRRHRESDHYRRFLAQAPDLLVHGPRGALFQSRRLFQRRPPRPAAQDR